MPASYAVLGFVIWSLLAVLFGMGLARAIDYADSAEPVSDDTAVLDDRPGTWL